MYDPVGPTPLWQNGRVLGGILFIHWDHLKSRVLNLKLVGKPAFILLVWQII